MAIPEYTIRSTFSQREKKNALGRKLRNSGSSSMEMPDLPKLLFEYDVFALGSVQQIRTGKDVERALRGFKLKDGALNNRVLVQFKGRCENMAKSFLTTFCKML